LKFITHSAWADALQWPDHELRTMRRLLDCPVRGQRVKGPNTPKCNVFEVDAVIAWLTKILPRLDPKNALELRTAAITID